MSRGLKILNLVQKSESEVKSCGKLSDSVYDFEKEEQDGDPWFYFNQWQENRTKYKLMQNENFGKITGGENIEKKSEKDNFIENIENENSEKKSENVNFQDKTLQKLNINNLEKDVNRNSDTEDNSEEIISSSEVDDSSISWKPVNEDSNDSTTNSSESEIIELIKPCIIKRIEQSESNIFNVQRFDEIKEINTVTENFSEKAQFDIQSKCNDLEQPHSSTQTAKINILNRMLIRQPIQQSRRNERRWDKKDRCPYCNQDITNFSRHLFRKHAEEESVTKILNCPKGSKARKNFIDLLRKEGNFSIYSENIRPVQRPSLKLYNNLTHSDEYLPCKYCKGLYKKESLSRHANKCYFNDRKDNSQIRYASEGQTILAFTESRRTFLNRLRLKSEVFNKMHADIISFNGKNDPIICQYADDYLRKHKRPHIKNVVSNKIRELGRLLIPLQQIYNINSMLEALKPEHYDKVVSAGRIISGYDEETKSFKSPSLALHLRTILLAVCCAAKTLILKKDPVLPITDHDKVLSDLKKFQQLVTSNWKFEMGSLALKDLNEKHSDKPQKLPLTEDIILFKNYCHKIAVEAMKNLYENLENKDSFKRLSETILALTILLNRKRVGDVQYIKLKSYNEFTTNIDQEECLNVLTETERELTKYFKRIVTVGKGSKIVPILFPKPIQEYIQVLLDVRNKTTFIPKENPFLFAMIGSSSKWIDGSTVLRKYASSCGAQSPTTLTSSRLRKQIATVLQILNLNDIEMEQVATFMGHTKKTHQEFYRLPQEVYQTSKIAKLLLMMDKGVTKEDEGKTLDQIDVELKSWEDAERVSEMHAQTEKNRGTINSDDIDKSVTNSSVEILSETLINDASRNKKNKENSGCRGSWSATQKDIMLKFFKNHIRNRVSPKKKECLELQQKYMDLFMKKTWVQIKVFVYNTYKSNSLKVNS